MAAWDKQRRFAVPPAERTHHSRALFGHRVSLTFCVYPILVPVHTAGHPCNGFGVPLAIYIYLSNKVREIRVPHANLDLEPYFGERVLRFLRAETHQKVLDRL